MRAKQNKRVLLGMSGGTDSSVAAIILQDAGYEVTGITFRFYEKDAHTEYLDDAAELCTRLHIPHLVYDAREIFQQRIITYFINEYLKGRTPVPCTLCNNLLKWPLLQQVADEQDIYHIATGHYVQKVLHNGRWHISAGSDPDKDQSFFLWGLSQETLQRMLLPMGNLTKKEVRALAAERGFTKMAHKRDSQGVCFCPGDYRTFLRYPASFTTKPASPSGHTKDILFIPSDNAADWVFIRTRHYSSNKSFPKQMQSSSATACRHWNITACTSHTGTWHAPMKSSEAMMKLSLKYATANKPTVVGLHLPPTTVCMSACTNRWRPLPADKRRYSIETTLYWVEELSMP